MEKTRIDVLDDFIKKHIRDVFSNISNNLNIYFSDFEIIENNYLSIAFKKEHIDINYYITFNEYFKTIKLNKKIKSILDFNNEIILKSLKNSFAEELNKFQKSIPKINPNDNLGESKTKRKIKKI